MSFLSLFDMALVRKFVLWIASEPVSDPKPMSFAERFAKAAKECGWQNRASTQDRMEVDKEDKLTSVVTTLGQYTLELPGHDGLTIVIRAERRLENGEERFTHHLERNHETLNEINDIEDAAVQAAMSKFMAAFNATV